MEKSMMDLFIEKNIGNRNDGYLREITKEEYEYNVVDDVNFSFSEKMKVCDLDYYDLLKDWSFPPHPLKKVILLEDYHHIYPEGTDWGYAFQFKHKGKHYLYTDIGGC